MFKLWQSGSRVPMYHVVGSLAPERYDVLDRLELGIPAFFLDTL